MLKAVIFDLDNTLTDFMKMKERAVESAAQAMEDAGFPKSRAEVVERIGRVYDREGIEYQKVFDDFIEEELGFVDPKILAAGIVGYRKGREGALELYPHVNMTMFELMKRGLKLAVLSDAPQMSAWLRLAYLKLHNVFDVVVTHDDTGRHKPDPEPFELVLRKLDIVPHEAIMVGDWPERDIKGARKLGIKTVYARYGNVNASGGHSPEFTINDIHELVGIVDYLNDQEELFQE